MIDRPNRVKNSIGFILWAKVLIIFQSETDASKCKYQKDSDWEIVILNIWKQSQHFSSFIVL